MKNKVQPLSEEDNPFNHQSTPDRKRNITRYDDDSKYFVGPSAVGLSTNGRARNAFQSLECGTFDDDIYPTVCWYVLPFQSVTAIDPTI